MEKQTHKFTHQNNHDLIQLIKRKVSPLHQTKVFTIRLRKVYLPTANMPLTHSTPHLAKTTKIHSPYYPQSRYITYNPPKKIKRTISLKKSKTTSTVKGDRVTFLLLKTNSKNISQSLRDQFLTKKGIKDNRLSTQC